MINKQVITYIASLAGIGSINLILMLFGCMEIICRIYTADVNTLPNLNVAAKRFALQSTMLFVLLVALSTLLTTYSATAILSATIADLALAACSYTTFNYFYKSKAAIIHAKFCRFHFSRLLKRFNVRAKVVTPLRLPYPLSRLNRNKPVSQKPVDIIESTIAQLDATIRRHSEAKLPK